MKRLASLLVLSLASCTGTGAFSDGTILGHDFSDAESAFHGGSTIIIVDRKMDCIDLGWVSRRYWEGLPPEGTSDFVALQLDLDGSLEAGTYTLGFDSPFSADGIVSDGADFHVEHVRDGTLVLEEADIDRVDGEFSLSFANDAVGGNFRTKECPSLGF